MIFFQWFDIIFMKAHSMVMFLSDVSSEGLYTLKGMNKGSELKQ